jgi:hypothetical protein
MSHNATKWLAENLPALRRVTYTDSAGKVRNAFRGEGLALAFFICDASNTYGTVMMTRETMSEKSGVSKVEIDRLLAAWIRGGFIAQVGLDRYKGRGRPTPVYALVGIPNEYKPEKIDAENARITIPISIPGDSSNLVEPLQPKENDYLLDSEPEPEPEPDSEPDSGSVVSKSARQEKAGINADEVMQICIELETEGMTLRGAPIQPGIVKSWKADYSRLIAQAIAEGHGHTADDVAWHCHNLRTEARTGRKAQGLYAGTLPRSAAGRQLPDVLKGMEGCLVCGGDGYGIIRDNAGVPTTRKCVCKGGTWEGEPTHEPTQERVSTDQGAYTDIPAPGASADPQSGARDLGDITGQLMRKYTKPIRPMPD